MTGIGPVAVRQPRIATARPARASAFGSTRPSCRLRAAHEEPGGADSDLYLKGISTGDFEEVLAALVGKDAPGLSASTIARLKDVWTEEPSAGRSAISRRSVTSTSGSTASTWKRGSRTRRNAFSS